MAYSTSTNYKKLIYDEDSEQIIDIIINGNLIDRSYIRTFTLSDEIFESDSFSLGSAITSKITLELNNEVFNDIGTSFDAMTFIFKIITDTGTESVPMGRYIIKEKDESSSDYTKYTLYDYMDKFDVEFDASNIVPCTRFELLQAVCDYCDVDLANTSILNGDAIVGVYDDSITAKTYLSLISERAGGFAKINRNNQLVIKTLSDVDTIELPTSKIGDYTTNDLKTITKIVYENATQKFEAGTDDGVTVYLSQDSPFSCTQEEVNNIFNKLHGLQYQTLDIRVWGDPAIDTGDMLTFDGIKSFAQKEWTFGNGFYGSYKTILSDSTSSLEVIKIPSKSNRKKLESRLNEAEGKITLLSEEVTENTEKVSTLEMDVDSIASRVSSSETKIEDITTTTQTSSGGNSLYLEDALESNALEYHIKGKSEQETRSGKNLYNFEDTATVGTSASADKDGWITISYDNSAGTSTVYVNYYTNNLNLKTGTNYNIILEIKNVSVNGASNIYPVSILSSTSGGQFTKSTGYALSSLSDNTIKQFISTTRDSFENIKDGLRTFVSFAAGVSGSITFRLSVLEDTTITADIFEYEAYGAMPSPEYPSGIKSVPSIRNLANYINNQTLNGITITHDENGIYTLNGNATAVTFFRINLDNKLSQGDYKTMTLEYISGTYTLSSTNWCMAYRIRNSNGVYSGVPDIAELQYNDSKLPIQTKNIRNECSVLEIAIVSGTILNDFKFKVQLEEGIIPHKYVPYGTWAKIKITGKNLFDLQTFFENTSATRCTKELIDNGIKIEFTAGADYWVGEALKKEIGIIDSAKKILIEAKANTIYTLSASSFPKCYVTYIDKNYNIINENYMNIPSSYSKTSYKFTTPADTKYLLFRFGISDSNYTSWTFTNIQLEEVTEENPEATEYEAYKEQEILVDLNKPNLFDKDNVKFSKGYITGSKEMVISDSDSTNKLYYLPIKSNTTYSVEKTVDNPFRIGTCSYEPIQSGNITTIVYNNSADKLTVISGASDKYLIIYAYNTNLSLLTEQEILDSIKVYEGYEPYYDLSSLPDGTSNDLDIIDGQVILNQNIEKIILDGSENWLQGNPSNRYYLDLNGQCNLNYAPISTHFFGYKQNTGFSKGVFLQNADSTTLRVNILDSDYISNVANFKSWLKTQYDNGTPVIIQYPLAESKQIILPNVQIPLFEGINHISLVDDLETNTSIKYYRKTAMSNDYVVQQQLNKTNANLSNTDSKVGQAQSDINATNTNLNNNYYNKNQIDVMNTSTEQMITQIKNSVETTTNATNLQISILQEQLKNGVTSVKTETGYTFDKDGLKIQKTGSEMSSQLDNDGLVVKRNETEVLTVRSSGVETENLKVRTYFTIGTNTRVENYKNGTGFFYVGGAN